MEGGSCPTCGTFGAPCSGVMCVQGAQQAPGQTGWVRGREACGVTEQRKHRRLRKAPYVPAFLLLGHLPAAPVAHMIQGSGPISCSGNTAVLEMLKEEEIQGWELPLAIIIFRQGNSSCLSCLPKSRTHHQAQTSSVCQCDTNRWDPETDRCRPSMPETTDALARTLPLPEGQCQGVWASSAPAHPLLPDQPRLSSLPFPGATLQAVSCLGKIRPGKRVTACL